MNAFNKKSKKYSLSRTTNTKKQKHMLFLIPPFGGNPPGAEKRASLSILKKASLTVESAIIIPLFFCITICIASIMGIYGQTLEKMSTLRDGCEQAAAAVSFMSDTVWIDVTQPMAFKPFFLPSGISASTVWCRGKARAWVGRSPSEAGTEDSGADTYVYLTENASVYHTSPECTHLDLSVHAASSGDLSSLRNEYGGRYQPCEKCVGHDPPAGIVYITDDGDCYHNDVHCAGLKRTVRMVEISEAEGLRECSRCASRES